MEQTSIKVLGIRVPIVLFSRTIVFRKIIITSCNVQLFDDDLKELMNILSKDYSGTLQITVKTKNNL